VISPEKFPDPELDTSARTGEQQTVLAGGCFWCVEAVYAQLDGVRDVTNGYAGGTKETADYDSVCSGRTGHAEVVQVEFDPAQVSYEELLDVFWHGHDPTTLNRQGPDVGDQYRSAIFFHSPEQEKAAHASLEAAQSRFRHAIVTEITPATDFWPAEDYHQQYLEKRGLASCHWAPKG